jgi:hypothetical protein
VHAREIFLEIVAESNRGMRVIQILVRYQTINVLTTREENTNVSVELAIMVRIVQVNC